MQDIDPKLFESVLKECVVQILSGNDKTVVCEVSAEIPEPFYEAIHKLAQIIDEEPSVLLSNLVKDSIKKVLSDAVKIAEPEPHIPQMKEGFSEIKELTDKLAGLADLMENIKTINDDITGKNKKNSK